MVCITSLEGPAIVCSAAAGRAVSQNPGRLKPGGKQSWRPRSSALDGWTSAPQETWQEGPARTPSLPNPGLLRARRLKPMCPACRRHIWLNRLAPTQCYRRAGPSANQADAAPAAGQGALPQQRGAHDRAPAHSLGSARCGPRPKMHPTKPDASYRPAAPAHRPA